MAKIAFRYGNVSFQDFVMFLTSKGAIHCEIIFTDNSVGYCSRKTGLVLKSVNDTDYRKDWVFYEIPFTPAQEQKAKEFFVLNQGKGYNWRGIIFSMIAGLNVTNDNAYFCSEICYQALTESGILKDYGFRASELSPENLQKIIKKLGWKRTAL